jgi:hypothetical protein
MGIHATVQDHLTATGTSPDWVVSLGIMIQKVLGTSSAIAAARAKDLSRLTPIGEALESIVKGWESLCAADLRQLSPMQRETIENVVLTILNDVQISIEKTRRI